MRALKKRKAFSIVEKMEILKEVDLKKENRTALAARFGIRPSTLSTILKQRAEIEHCYRQFGIHPRKRMTRSPYDGMETLLVDWYRQCKANDTLITVSLLREKALKIAHHLGISDFKASSSWIQNFRRRHHFTCKLEPGEISKKDPFIEQVGSVMVAAQDLFKNNRNSPESAKDLPLQEISQEGIIEIVKTDISLPEDEFQNSSECHSDDFSIDSNPTDIMVTEDSAIELVPEGRQTFSNIMNLSGCSSTQHVPCSSTEEIHQPLTNMELTETTTGSVHDVTAKSPDTSTHRPQCYILVSSSLDTTQQNVNKISKTLSSVKPIELDRSKSESSDLTRAKLEAVKVMTKNSIEEHSMLKEMFAIKMLQEKEKLELERRKYDVENERLAQEKIKSQILLLQLEQLRRTVN